VTIEPNKRLQTRVRRSDRCIQCHGQEGYALIRPRRSTRRSAAGGHVASGAVARVAMCPVRRPRLCVRSLPRRHLGISHDSGILYGEIAAVSLVPVEASVRPRTGGQSPGQMHHATWALVPAMEAPAAREAEAAGPRVCPSLR
jgi:hypothetical protein